MELSKGIQYGIYTNEGMEMCTNNQYGRRNEETISRLKKHSKSRPKWMSVSEGMWHNRKKTNSCVM